MKKNCWEYRDCGRQPGGGHEEDLGTCPASTEARLDGIHGGRNAGRACWVVAGTMCCGAVQGSFAKKCVTCIECDFYSSVMKDEGARFMAPNTLLSILGEYKGPLPADYY